MDLGALSIPSGGGTHSGMDLRGLGRMIRDRRGTLNMTQPELADRAGVSLAYVHMLEAGGLPQPGLDSLLQVARTLDLARLVSLLDEVSALRTRDSVPQSVIDNATADADSRA